MTPYQSSITTGVPPRFSDEVFDPRQPTLQLIYDAAPIGLAFLSPDCRYLQVNQRLTDICGISVEDHLGRYVRDCVPALADAVEGIVQSIMRTGDPVTGVEVAGQRADQTDERFWVTYWHPHRNADGEIVGVNVAAEEITERKRAEAALRASERQFHTLADSIPQLVWMAHADGAIYWLNSHWYEYTGRPAGEIDPHAWHTVLGNSWTEALATGTALESELSLLSKDGEYRPFLTRVVPLRDPHGVVYRWIGTHIDISERKRSEREVRRARDAAEAALQNLRDTQNWLIEAEKLAALGRLVAGVAHEINNPLGTSLTVASSLERKSRLFAAETAQGTLKRSSLNEFVDAVRDGSAQLQESLNRAAGLIQSFKQVASDRNNSELRSFDLGDLTEQVATGLRPALPKHGVTLNVECEKGLSISSYPGSYGQVLTNLFLNSIAHAFPDGRQGNIAIKVSACGDNDVEIIFSDDGCGMSPDVRRQAFDPFFSTRRHQGGTGLGLHIVYSVVTDRLGGQLRLSSEPGAGTDIRIILPRQMPDST
ncbi:PAS domain-containing protein [Bradyrhizobium sp. SRL28]|uniref:PAS domain-containing sensor histidine kinase n=1 Tax=Bradyrhizobium sp. SRL28 TaxID=2836178 RepID=UPI001BDF08E2|nr:PAS domain-containing protein [Bradyrhizobium sp. SRL28]